MQVKQVIEESSRANGVLLVTDPASVLPRRPTHSTCTFKVWALKTAFGTTQFKVIDVPDTENVGGNIAGGAGSIIDTCCGVLNDE